MGEKNKSDQEKLEALEDFRRGYVQMGLTRMGVDLTARHGVLNEAFLLGFEVPKFDKDRPEHFIVGMAAVADELERTGY